MGGRIVNGFSLRIDDVEERSARRAKDHRQYNGKVSEDYVRCIRRAHADGVDLGSLASRFTKIGRQAIWEIVTRRTWRHVV